MGCDIHFFAETRKPDGTWEAVKDTCYLCEASGESDYELRCAGCGRSEYFSETDEDIQKDHIEGKCLYGPGRLQLVPGPCNMCQGTKICIKRMYRGRDYNLFGVLANVRGSPDPNFTEANRGIPADASPEYMAYFDADMHSPTWYTLTELLKRNWADYLGFDVTVATMRELADNTDDVRAVFCFDN